MEEPTALPKKIHFIWAGGPKRLGAKDIATIVAWARKNPDWHVHVWVDKETTSNALALFMADFRSALEHEENREELLRRIEILDISENRYELNFRDPFISYEIEKFFPNYGASSDFLRYHILYELGGAYFDTDVFPGQNSLSQIVDEFLKPTLYVDFASQRTFGDFKENDPTVKAILSALVIYAAGNDAFICTRRNPLMLRFLQEAQENYEKVKNNDNERLMAAYGSKNIRELTIKRTGPGLIDGWLKANSLPDEQHGYLICENTLVKRLRNGTVELVKPSPINNMSWLSAGINEYGDAGSYGKAMERLKKIMGFEFKKFGVISLDEHIADMVTACPFIPREDIERMIIDPVLGCCVSILRQNLDFRPMLEITGRYRATLVFAEENNIPTLFDFPPEQQIEALNHLLRNWIPGDPGAELPQYLSRNVDAYIRFFMDKVAFLEALLIGYKSRPQQGEMMYNHLRTILADYVSLFSSIETVVETGAPTQEFGALHNKLRTLSEANGIQFGEQPAKRCTIF
jgi:hypothetical protein